MCYPTTVHCGCSNPFGKYWKVGDIDYRELAGSIEYFNSAARIWVKA